MSTTKTDLEIRFYYTTRRRLIRPRSPSIAVRSRSPGVLVRRRNSSSRIGHLRSRSYEPSPRAVRDIEETEKRGRSTSRPPSRSVRIVRVSGDHADHVRRRPRSASVDSPRRVSFDRSPSRGRTRTREHYAVRDRVSGETQGRRITDVDGVLEGDYTSPPYSPPGMVP